MDRRVAPPTWGRPPPCKQALSFVSAHVEFQFTEVLA